MNDVTALRSTLFDLLNEVKNPDSKIDLDRAKTACLVVDKLIDTAKVEIEFARVNGSVDSQFFHKPTMNGQQQLENKSTNNAATRDTPTGTVTIDGNVTRHISK